MLKIYIFIFIKIIFIKNTFGEDVFYNLNNKYVLHKVSEKFLSLSIDPAVLLAGANLSDASLLLARHLSPAFIRLAGPSTPFVKYIDNEDDLISRKSEEGITNVIITPSMWFGINEWLNLANLTPVFGINDNETDKGVWDPKSTLPLLEMSDKFGVTCYWQLGYDCSNKTMVQYVEDLNILRQTLNGFPEHNGTWKVVGSDLSRCILDGLDNNNFGNYISDLDENVDALMWESSLVPKTQLGFSKAALWTSIPKDPKPVTFSSAMEWAKRVGETAKMEYDVVFRQPRLLEMTHDTAVYWFSFLHKKLMGTTVLDIMPINFNLDLSTFAHCTKRQNSFIRTGAITIMMINNGSETGTGNIRLGNIMIESSMEVQSYLLTASDESATEVYLNGQKLTMEMLKKADDILKPRLRRAKIRGYVSLEIPAKTIGFFVITGAKITLCSNNEADLDSILSEINTDQELSLSEKAQFQIEGRWPDLEKGNKFDTVGEKTTLETIKKNILKEMELDKKYYSQLQKKQNGDNSLPESFKNKQDIDRKKETLHKHLRTFIEKAKKSGVSKDSGIKYQKEKPVQSSNLHFTIKEIEDILKKRAKAKAAVKNIKLTSSELDMLVDKATIILPKHFISKRDINRLLLEEKANFHQNNMFSQETYERYAKQAKFLPTLKYRRSKPGYGRIRRNINRKLLDLKAKLEEHKKYMLQRNSHLRNSNNSNKHKSLFSRLKRDINLDLLRKHTRPTPSYGKHNIAVQPNYSNSYKTDLSMDDQEKYPGKMLLADSDELFPDFLGSDERTMEDTTPKKLYPKMENIEMDLSDLESFFKKSKKKDKINFSNLFYKPKLDTAFARKSTHKKKNKPSDLGYIKLELSNEFDNFDERFPPRIHEWEFLFDSPKEVKSNGFTDLWHLGSPRMTENQKEKFTVTDLDDSIFPDNFEYGYIRKKRENNSLAKEKLKMLIHDAKSEVKKIKQQVAEDKVKYIRKKIKNKMELRRQNQIKKFKDGGLLSTKTIKTIPDNQVADENNQNKNLSQASKENTVATADNRMKRSLFGNNLNSLFGQYQPLTTGLKPWKPTDMLAFQNPYLTTLPLYTWMQNQNLRNTLLQNGIWLRKRRYIDTSFVNSVENEIFSDEDEKKYNKEMGKTEFVKYPKENLLKGNKLMKEGEKEIDKIDFKFPKRKFPKKSLLKEKPLVNENNYLEGIDKMDDRNRTITIKEKTTQKSFESAVDKIVAGEKVSYLEKILGQNVKPLEDLVEMIEKAFSNINKSVRNFFKNMF